LCRGCGEGNVIPAQAGTQGARIEKAPRRGAFVDALGPRLRGDDEDRE